MDPDREPRPQQRQRFRGALRIDVPGREPRPPARNGEEGDVDRPEVGHRGEEIGVSAKKIPPRR